MSGPADNQSMSNPVSANDLKGQLYTSLQGKGVINSLKTQLRSQLLEQLRRRDNGLLEGVESAEPPLQRRVLNSLFVDYLRAAGHTYTLSVFLPECGMAGCAPFSRQELLHILRLEDRTSVLHRFLHLAEADRSPDSSTKALAVELLEALQRMHAGSLAVESATQTIDTASSQHLEGHLREVESAYLAKVEAERLLPYRTLEERMGEYRKEVDQRMREEVAAAVARVREFEVGAARMEEAARFRRQLESARADLERVHSERVERLRVREDALLDRLKRKEKTIDAAAYEHRQRILAETEALREREANAKQLADLQAQASKLQEERIAEREAAVRAKEEDAERYRTVLRAQAEEAAHQIRREVEREYEGLMKSLERDRNLLEVERARFTEERQAVVEEVAAARNDRERLRVLQQRLAAVQAQRDVGADAIRELEERLRKASSESDSLHAQLRSSHGALEQTREQLARLTSSVEGTQKDAARIVAESQTELERARAALAEERQARKLQTALAKKDIRHLQALLKDKELEGVDFRNARTEWELKERTLQATVRRLQAAADEAGEGRERALQRAEELAMGARTAAREAADLRALLQQTQQALEVERQARYSLMVQAGTENIPRSIQPPPRPPTAKGGLRGEQFLGVAYSPDAAWGEDKEGGADVPLVGPKSAALTGALQRLTALQREEEGMQAALDEFRARLAQGRRQGSSYLASADALMERPSRLDKCAKASGHMPRSPSPASTPTTSSSPLESSGGSSSPPRRRRASPRQARARALQDTPRIRSSRHLTKLREEETLKSQLQSDGEGELTANEVLGEGGPVGRKQAVRLDGDQRAGLRGGLEDAKADDKGEKQREGNRALGLKPDQGGVRTEDPDPVQLPEVNANCAPDQEGRYHKQVASTHLMVPPPFGGQRALGIQSSNLGDFSERSSLKEQEGPSLLPMREEARPRPVVEVPSPVTVVVSRRASVAQGEAVLLGNDSAALQWIGGQQEAEFAQRKFEEEMHQREEQKRQEDFAAELERRQKAVEEEAERIRQEDEQRRKQVEDERRAREVQIREEEARRLREQAEQERVEQERAAKARAELERVTKELLERERVETERAEKERQEEERMETEKRLRLEAEEKARQAASRHQPTSPQSGSSNGLVAELIGTNLQSDESRANTPQQRQLAAEDPEDEGRSEVGGNESVVGDSSWHGETMPDDLADAVLDYNDAFSVAAESDRGHVSEANSYVSMEAERRAESRSDSEGW